MDGRSIRAALYKSWSTGLHAGTLTSDRLAEEALEEHGLRGRQVDDAHSVFRPRAGRGEREDVPGAQLADRRGVRERKGQVPRGRGQARERPGGDDDLQGARDEAHLKPIDLNRGRGALDLERPGRGSHLCPSERLQARCQRSGCREQRVRARPDVAGLVLSGDAILERHVDRQARVLIGRRADRGDLGPVAVHTVPEDRYVVRRGDPGDDQRPPEPVLRLYPEDAGRGLAVREDVQREDAHEDEARRDQRGRDDQGSVHPRGRSDLHRRTRRGARTEEPHASIVSSSSDVSVGSSASKYRRSSPVADTKARTSRAIPSSSSRRIFCHTTITGIPWIWLTSFGVFGLARMARRILFVAGSRWTFIGRT